MKQKLSICAIFILVLTCAIPVNAISEEKPFPDIDLTEGQIVESIEVLEDGDYIITTIQKPVIQTFSTTKSLSKTVARYSSTGVKRYDVTLNASFSVNAGKNVSCTKANYVISIYESGWKPSDTKVTNGGLSTTSTKATFSGKFKKGLQSHNETLRITCDKNGKIS